MEKAFAIYEKEKETKGAQLIFCDLSTPKNDGNFNVYDDIKQKLMSKGVPENEIAFIHDANTETKKADLFAKVRSGDVRFLLGSTAKMGAGTNVQDRLIALHHLDVPWRPSDIISNLHHSKLSDFPQFILFSFLVFSPVTPDTSLPPLPATKLYHPKWLLVT